MENCKKILLENGINDSSNISLGVLCELIVLHKNSKLNLFKKKNLTEDLKNEIRNTYKVYLKKGFTAGNVFKLYEVLEKLSKVNKNKVSIIKRKSRGRSL